MSSYARNLLIFLVSIPMVRAKFKEIYLGIATDGVQACIHHSNFTLAQMTTKSNCGDAFKCVINNIPNQYQSILSSWAAILGFVRWPPAFRLCIERRVESGL
jgi:hypothetical protein